MKQRIQKFIKATWGEILVQIVISVVVFCLILLPTHVRLIKVLGGAARYNSPRFILGFGAALWLAFKMHNPRHARLAAGSLIFAAFAFALSGLWSTMNTQTNVIAGVLPRVDAFSFFSDSILYLQKGLMVGYTHRRPLYSLFMAGVIWAGGSHILIAHALATWLLAWATLGAMLVVRKMLGPLAAVLFFIPPFFYVRAYLGNSMSELLGFGLGMAAFALFAEFLLLKEIRRGLQIALYCLSVFIWALAQLARPAALATLPLVVIFGAFIAVGKKRALWRWLALGFAALAAAFAVNQALFNLVSGRQISPTNNAWYGLYGLATGGKGWGQLVSDHPEIGTFSPDERDEKILGIVIEQIKGHPEDLLKGVRVMFTQTFSLKPVEPVNIFSFVMTRNPAFDQALIYGLYLLGLAGIVFCLAWNGELFSQYLLVMIAGFLLSMPLAPTYQTSYMRYYAASMPLIGLIPAYGLFGLQKCAARKWTCLEPKSHKEPEMLWVYGVFPAALAIMAIFIPVILPKQVAKAIEAPVCPNGLSPVVFPFYEGSQATIIRQDFKNRGWVPFIYDDKFLRDAHNIPQKDMIQYLKKLDFPVSIFTTINLLNDASLYAIVDPGQLPNESGVFKACGLIEDEQNQLSESGFFFPKSDFLK